MAIRIGSTFQQALEQRPRLRRRVGAMESDGDVCLEEADAAAAIVAPAGVAQWTQDLLQLSPEWLDRFAHGSVGSRIEVEAAIGAGKGSGLSFLRFAALSLTIGIEMSTNSSLILLAVSSHTEVARDAPKEESTEANARESGNSDEKR